MRTFTENERLDRIMAGAAGGFGDVLESDVLDCAGFGAVVLVTALGAITSTGACTMTVSGCDTDDGEFTPITGATASAADTGSGKLLMIEIFEPQYEFVKVNLARATANVVVDGVFSVLRDPQHGPVTQGTAVIDSAFVPATEEPT